MEDMNFTPIQSLLVVLSPFGALTGQAEKIIVVVLSIAALVITATLVASINVDRRHNAGKLVLAFATFIAALVLLRVTLLAG
jgi:hypothetical protein